MSEYMEEKITWDIIEHVILLNFTIHKKTGKKFFLFYVTWWQKLYYINLKRLKIIESNLIVGFYLDFKAQNKFYVYNNANILKI